MGSNSRAIEWLSAVCTAAALGMTAIAIYVGSRPAGGDPSGWFLAAGLAFSAAIVVPGFYFGLHPMFVALDRRRSAILSSARVNPNTLIIFRASYGAGLKVKSVKRIVESHITEQGAIDLLIDAQTMGGNPVPEIQNELSVTYAVRGGRRTTVFLTEGERLVLPPPAVSPTTPRSGTPTTEPSPDQQPSPELSDDQTAS